MGHLLHINLLTNNGVMEPLHYFINIILLITSTSQGDNGLREMHHYFINMFHYFI